MKDRTNLNVRETAARLGVHENTVRNWVERGTLRAYRLPGSGYRRFRPEEVERVRAAMLEASGPLKPETSAEQARQPVYVGASSSADRR